MAFKWVNPGYGELFTEQKIQTKNKYPKLSKFGFYIENGLAVTKFPITKEIWIKFDAAFYSLGYADSQGRIYVNNTSSNKCGLYVTSSSGVCEVQLLTDNSTVATHSQIVCETQTIYTFVLHIKSDATDGVIEVFKDGVSMATYSGNVYGGKEIDTLYFNDGSDFEVSNIIVSDTDISNENIAIVDLKDLTGTWEGITTGMAKATDAGQTLSHTIDVAKLKDTMAKYSSDATITSIVLSAKDIQYDAEKVNSLTASIVSGTSSVFSETKRISDNNTLPQAVYIKNIAADSLSNMKLELKSVKV